MDSEKKIAELQSQMPTGNIEAELSAEVDERLKEIAHQSALLNCETMEIGRALAVRLAKTPEEADGICGAIAMYVLRLATIEALRILPDAPPLAVDDDSILDGDTLSE